MIEQVLNKSIMMFIALTITLMGCTLTGDDKTDVNAECRELTEAIAAGEQENILNFIKSQGVNLKEEKGNTALHYAALCADGEFVSKLIRAGASPRARNNGGWSPLHAAAYHSDYPEVISLLIRAGANPNARTGSSDTPLHLAAIHNCNPGIVVALIEGGADGGAFNKENPRAKANLIVDGGDSTPFELLSTCLENTEAYWVLKDASHFRNR